MIQPVSTQSEVPFFFDKKNVIAPVRGGGKGMPTSNPYSQANLAKTVAIKPQAQPLSFEDFKQKQEPGNSKAPAKPQKANNKVLPMTLGNSAAPIIKPEFQT